MNYVGIDYHKKFSYVTVLNEEGGVIKKGRIDNDSESVEAVFEGLEGENKVVMEAGWNTLAMFDLLEQFGDEVLLAHPLKVKAIASAKITTDTID